MSKRREVPGALPANSLSYALLNRARRTRATMRLPTDQEARDRARKTLDRNQFLDAGAGCGKTRVLVDHYIEILARTPDIGPHQIIAATFTKKAAAEMKERVREECRKRAAQSEGDAWRRVSRDIETAPIDTIHGLCSRILHENAVAARIDPSFAVLEETDAGLLLEETVRRALLDRLDAEAQSAAELVAALGFTPSCAAVRVVIDGRARLAAVAFPDGEPLSAEELRARWDELAPQAQEILLDLLARRAAWRKAKATLLQHHAQSDADVLEQLRTKRLRLIEQAEDRGLLATRRLDALRQLTEGSVSEKSAKQWASEDERKRVAEALRTFSLSGGANRKSIGEVLAATPSEDDAECARLTSALLTETDAALRAYEEAKRRASALDFEDLQLLVRDLWRDRPDILAQYRRRVRHVLIDEFQDTNSLQTDILWPLSEGGANLFVVGDAKQSIYRFRNADVTVFNRTRDEMRRAPGASVERLEVNFRSTPAMTALFNDLFSNDEVMGGAGDAEYDAIYEPSGSYREWEGEDALEVHVVTAAGGDDDEANSPTLADLREKEAALLAQRVWELVEGEAPGLVGGEDDTARPARFGDFAMLFRAMSDIAIYERALRLRGVPYYVVSGRGFYERQEVTDVVHCIRVLENTRDEVALVGALRSPMFSLSDETLFWLSQAPGAWWERLQAVDEEPMRGPLANLPEGELAKARRAALTLRELRGRKNRMTLSALIGEVIDRTGISAVLATRFGGDQMVSNLRKLIEIAGEFEQSGGHSLRALIERLQHLVVREEREGQAPVAEEKSDVVKLLTIHKAKGLEWPIVVVPDLGRGRRRADSTRLISHPNWGVLTRARDEDATWPAVGLAINALNDAEDLAEARRLFYVACTRARDLLVLSSSFTDWKGGAEATALRWITNALDMDPESPGEAVIGGEGWRGIATVIRSDDVPDLPPSPGFSRPGAPALIGPDEPPQDIGSQGDDAQIARGLVRSSSPIALDHQAKARFNATELATYLDCPRRYELRYVLGVPDEAPRPPTLRRDEALSPLELGDVVHRVLRVVGAGGKDRLEEALDQGLAVHAHGGRRAQVHREQIRRMVTWYLETDLYAEKIEGAARLRTEMSVQFEAEGALLEGVIDALAERSNGDIHIIDFKTGRADREHAAQYEFQIGLYCAGVARVGPGNLSSADIVYLSQEAPEIVGHSPARAGEDALAKALEAVDGIRRGRLEARRSNACARCGLRWACAQ